MATKLTIVMYVVGPEHDEVAEIVDTLLDNGSIQDPIKEFAKDRLGEGTFEITSAACLTESTADLCGKCGRELDPAFEWPSGAHDACPVGREVV